ncbi:MAG: hypothetical protein AB7O96_00985 [Pseudobdellovibrionaceae bacterium]
MREVPQIPKYLIAKDHNKYFEEWGKILDAIVPYKFVEGSMLKPIETMSNYHVLLEAALRKIENENTR